jgi:Spy/CpxP family protein refolding chaperone
MRTFGRSVLALGALCILTSPAMAQGRGGFGGGLMLYTNPGIQKELKFSEAQTTKVADVVKDLREKYQDKLQAARESQDRDEMMKLQREQTADAKKLMADILKPEQVKRFDQISLQQRGAMAFADAEVAKKLSLTDDQKTKIKDISDDSMGKQRELFQGLQDDREGTMKKLADLRKETLGKVSALLSDDQKKTWKDMTGEPFEVTFPPRNN